jgi:hypothetical protein
LTVYPKDECLQKSNHTYFLNKITYFGLTCIKYPWDVLELKDQQQCHNASGLCEICKSYIIHLHVDVYIIVLDDGFILLTLISASVTLPIAVYRIWRDMETVWKGYKKFVQQEMELRQKTNDGLNLNSLLGSYLIRHGTRNKEGYFLE